VSRLRALYGASPGHLVALAVGGLVSAYAVTRVPDLSTLVSIALWFGFMLIAHDLLLYPVYAAADGVAARVQHRARPRVPWTNYVRVPTVLSGLLLLAWFPLVLRLSSGYGRASGRSDDGYLGRWLAVTAVLFAVSGLLYLVRVVTTRRRSGAPGPATDPGS